MNIHETESDEKQGHCPGLSQLTERAHRPTYALKALCPHLDVVELEARHGEVLLVHEHRAVLLCGDRGQHTPGCIPGDPGVASPVHLAHAQGSGKGVLAASEHRLDL